MDWLNLYHSNLAQFHRLIVRLPDDERDAIMRDLTLDLNRDWLLAQGLSDGVPIAVTDAAPTRPIPVVDILDCDPPSIMDLISVAEMARKTRIRVATPAASRPVRVRDEADFGDVWAEVG